MITQLTLPYMLLVHISQKMNTFTNLLVPMSPPLEPLDHKILNRAGIYWHLFFQDVLF